MKTTKQRLWNIVIAMSVVINLGLLGGVGYLALIDNHANRLSSALNSPVVVYVDKSIDISSVTAPIKSPAKP